MRSRYWGGATWWALQSFPWFRYGSRYSRHYKAMKRMQRVQGETI